MELEGIKIMVNKKEQLMDQIAGLIVTYMDNVDEVSVETNHTTGRYDLIIMFDDETEAKLSLKLTDAEGKEQ
jgi:hypothetical protein